MIVEGRNKPSDILGCYDLPGFNGGASPAGILHLLYGSPPGLVFHPNGV
jgi:hypothetical protein